MNQEKYISMSLNKSSDHELEIGAYLSVLIEVAQRSC